MARPTNAEIARRKAAAEASNAEAGNTSDEPTQLWEPEPPVTTETATTTPEPVAPEPEPAVPAPPIEPAPEPVAVAIPPTPAPVPAPPVTPKETSIYDVAPNDLKHFQEHKLASEKQKSLEAIEQAVKDACKIAEAKVRDHHVVKALADDPGDVGKRLKFLSEFGPASVKPPKPAITPFGTKDPELMEWYAKYEPANFVSIYGKGASPLAKRLLATIQAS